MAPVMMDQLPIIKKVYKWFKGDGLVIDSPLFKLHHQVSTLVLIVGFIYISVENHLDESILCQAPPSISAYAKSYCWIHGTAYLRQHLQGKATGCFVDQSRIQSEEDAPITAYYLWLPYLLTFCMLFAKFPHSMWKTFFEHGLMQSIIDGNGNRGKGAGGQSNSSIIAQNFIKYCHRYNSYHQKFCVWESMNILMVIISFYLTHWLLNYKFLYYGLEVGNYIGTVKRIEPQDLTHNPMCELFPTEVACTFRIGASTGGIDRSNFLCILGNNLFNQKYFLILWIWWVFLLAVSALGLVYRLATASVPSFAMNRLERRIHGAFLKKLRLTSAECFVLDMILDNMSAKQMEPGVVDQVVEEIEKLEEKRLKDLEGINYTIKTYSYLNENSDHMSETSLTESDTRLHITSEHAPNGYIPIKPPTPV